MNWGGIILAGLAAACLALGGWHIGHRQGLEEAWHRLDRQDEIDRRLGPPLGSVCAPPAEPDFDACLDLLGGHAPPPSEDRWR